MNALKQQRGDGGAARRDRSGALPADEMAARAAVREKKRIEEEKRREEEKEAEKRREKRRERGEKKE